MSFNRYANPAPQFQGPQSPGPQFNSAAAWASRNPNATPQAAMQAFAPIATRGAQGWGAAGQIGGGWQPSNGFQMPQQAMAMSLLARPAQNPNPPPAQGSTAQAPQWQAPQYDGSNFNMAFGPGNYLSYLYALMGGLRGQGW